MSHDNKAVLVTGGAVRIGRACCEALVSSGSGVAIHYRDSAESARELVAWAKDRGVPALALEADLADSDSAAALVERASAGIGPLTGLVNNASKFDHRSFERTDLDHWQRHLDVNLTAPFLLSQAFARQAPAGSCIVNLLDWRALRPTAASFAYTVAKAGLAAMTQSLAQILAPDVRVNGLALGTILPEPGSSGFSAEALARIPAGRVGTIEEVVDALMFLLDGPTYLTGEILHLDGGASLV